MTGGLDLSCRNRGPALNVKIILKPEKYTAYQKRLLLLADGDYVAARVLFYHGSFYPVVIRLLREALEKYLKLLYLLLADVPDREADGRLRVFNHRLGNVAAECAKLANGDLRYTMVLTHPRFRNILEMSDQGKYETVTRYPAPFVVPGSIVDIFDHAIKNTRSDLLGVDDDPVDRVEMWKNMPEWRSIDSVTIRRAFHHANKRFPGVPVR